MFQAVHAEGGTLRAYDTEILTRRSADGPLERWYPEGPLALWRQWGHDVWGHAIEGGHFFPEASPAQTILALRTFFSGSA